MIALTICAAIISLIALYPLHFVFGKWTLLAAVLVAIYITPLRNKKGRSIGIRNIPVLKGPLIAAVCALVTIGLSVDVIPNGEREMLKWIAIPQFAFFLAITTTYDISDVHNDDRGLKTFPQLFGVTGTKLLAVILMVPLSTFYSGYLFLDDRFTTDQAWHGYRLHVLATIGRTGDDRVIITRANQERMNGIIRSGWMAR